MLRELVEMQISGFAFVRAAADVDKLEGELREQGWFVGRGDCAGADDKPLLVDAIATALRFPKWTGRNWDALEDAMTDLGWIDESGVVLVLEGLNDLRANAGADWINVREIIVEAVEWWQHREKTLIVLVA